MLYKPYNSTIPSRYDLRDYGLVTSVKNQGNTGTCWAHSAINSAESNLIINKKADNQLLWAIICFYHPYEKESFHRLFFCPVIADPLRSH